MKRSLYILSTLLTFGIILFVGDVTAQSCPSGQYWGISATGNADLVTASNSISNPTSALGIPDLVSSSNSYYAKIDNNNDYLVVDLTDEVQPGDVVLLYIGSDDGNNSKLRVQGTLNSTDYANGSGFFDTQIFTTSADLDKNNPSQDIVAYTITSGTVRYLRFTRSQGKPGVNGLSYSVSGCIPANPTGVDDESHGYDNVTNNINVLENDIDPQNLALSISIATPPSNGTAVVRADNTIDYSSNSGFAGTDVLTYQVCNTSGLCDIAALTITVGGQAINMAPGSYIINMGVQPQTESNGLKPYGMVYELTTEYSVPIDWIINPSKEKDGVDFNYNGLDYRGGPFIIREEYIDATIMAVISDWEDEGVIGTYTTSDLTVPVDKTIDYFMGWTLDAQNGDIAEEYLLTAGIPSSAYNWLEPAELGCCNDVFVMPHADPTWEDHSNLLTWNDDGANGGCDGTIFAACHAVSALENLFNPNNPSEQMNFLSEKTGIAAGNDDYADNSLILWGDHDDGSAPFQYDNQTHPEMQFMGGLDESLTNGSEEIFIPHLQWRPETVIGGWDPDNDEVSGNQVASVLAYGPAFGDATRGKVMYMAGHRHDKEEDPDHVAAQRAFFNFSFNAAIEKSIRLGSGIMPASMTLTQYSENEFSVVATGGTGAGYIYSWSSSCGGTFSDPTAATTIFTPLTTGVCVITCEVSDACGRRSFSSVPYVVDAGCNNGILEFEKIVGADTVVEGQSITYTYNFDNRSGQVLSQITFQDVLTNGLTWSSDPINISGGISFQGLIAIEGNSNASFTIKTIPEGISSFDISVDIPKPYSGSSQYATQAELGNLPAIFNGSVYSNVSPLCTYAPSNLVILSETDCYGIYNMPVLGADFAFDHKSVDANSTRPINNVVLNFSDGTIQMLFGFNVYSGTFAGTGIHEDKCIIGVWIRTACNETSDGPNYGEYIASTIWDGLCGTPDVVIHVIAVHETTVDEDDHIQIDFHTGIDLDNGNNGNGAENGTGSDNGNGHGGPNGPIYTGPVRGHREATIIEPISIKVFPNPARAYENIQVNGLDSDKWTMNMYSISGRQVHAQLMDESGRIDLAAMNLVSGLYVLEFSNENDRISSKIMVYE